MQLLIKGNTVSKSFYELEQSLMGCQGVIDDLKTLSSRLANDHRKLSDADVIDLIRGLSVLYEMKFDKTWAALNDFRDK